jgi:hypothetical protein
MNKIELKNHKVSGPEYIIQWNLKYSCFVGKREYHKVDIPFPFYKKMIHQHCLVVFLIFKRDQLVDSLIQLGMIIKS